MTRADTALAWHAVSGDEVLTRLTSSATGLTSDEAARRLRRYGPNRLDLTPPASRWSILIAQFRSVVVLLLLAAAVAAWFLGDPVDAAAIAAVLVINAALGFVTELRARRAMEALRRLEVPRAHVLRDGRRIEIASSSLVPGDVIVVEGGQSVPADARLLAANDLRTAEAALTGESLPLDKRAEAVLPGAR
jgi:P-type Ca2+ transporter type 2C